MKFIDEYRDADIGKRLIERIHRRSKRPIRLMEFCGGHTVAIMKHGIRQLLPLTTPVARSVLPLTLTWIKPSPWPVSLT